MTITKVILVKVVNSDLVPSFISVRPINGKHNTLQYNVLQHYIKTPQDACCHPDLERTYTARPETTSGATLSTKRGKINLHAPHNRSWIPSTSSLARPFDSFGPLTQETHEAEHTSNLRDVSASTRDSRKGLWATIAVSGAALVVNLNFDPVAAVLARLGQQADKIRSRFNCTGGQLACTHRTVEGATSGIDEVGTELERENTVDCQADILAGRCRDAVLLAVRTALPGAGLVFDPVPELAERLRGIARLGLQVLSDSNPVADLAKSVVFFLTTLHGRVVRHRQEWVLGLLERWQDGRL
jgi:hypothetical protein